MSIRLAICQSGIPRYRMPVFNLLGAQQDIELTVFADRSRAVEQAAAHEVVHFHHEVATTRTVRWLPGQFFYQQAQLDAIDPDRFDLVILQSNLRYRSLGPSMRKARTRGMPLALWGHGYSKRPGRVREWSRNRVAKRADAVLLYSRTIADRLIERAGFDRTRVFVAQNAIDQGPVQRARQHWLDREDELRAFQTERGIDPAQTVIFVSRLFRANRADMLIEALVRLRQKRPAAKLMIIGGGEARDELVALADRLGQRDHVIFGGAIFDDMVIAPWMLSASLYCYPVNIGLSLMHAFGYGLPVVTSDDIASHNPEIEALEDGRNGLLYGDGDVDDMVDTWQRIMDDAEFRAQLAKRAHKQVLSKYTLENMVQGFLDLTAVVDGVARKVHPLEVDEDGTRAGTSP